MTAIHFTCPHCRATPGERCVNYLKKPCAPHRQRTDRAFDATVAKKPDDCEPEAQEPQKVQRSLFE